jgi:hemoglobin/transferrin/lactoferrin receptor protein
VKVADLVTLRAGIFNIFDTKDAWWSDVRGLAMTANPAAVTNPALPAYINPAVANVYTQPGRNASVSLSVRF